MFILRTDSIAQEDNETFTIELVPREGSSQPSADGIFFRNTAEVTIIDSDGKSLCSWGTWGMQVTFYTFSRHK